MVVAIMVCGRHGIGPVCLWFWVVLKCVNVDVMCSFVGLCDVFFCLHHASDHSSLSVCHRPQRRSLPYGHIGTDARRLPSHSIYCKSVNPIRYCHNVNGLL